MAGELNVRYGPTAERRTCPIGVDDTQLNVTISHFFEKFFNMHI